MTRLFVKLAMVAVVVLASSPTLAQMHPPQYSATKADILPPAKKAGHVKIVKAPELELAHDDLAIVRWTTTNPGGDDEHFGVVHYGTNPSDLSQTAKSHIRLNRVHPETIFRVRMPGLKPQTTYYYWVTSAGSDGTSDSVNSTVNHFTTPAPGERIIAYPQPGFRR
jgi:Purple acid Phosphatase, N-terminal domain